MTEERTPNPSSQDKILAMLTTPREGIQTAFELAEALDGNGQRLVIERRKLQAEQPTEAPRAESQARAHTFYAATGFIAYLKRFGSQATVVYADPESRCVEAVLDETAEKGREVVVLRPQTHPRWAPWRALLGQRVNLDTFRELVTQNRKTIVEPDGRALIFTLRQIRMSTEVQLQSGVVKGGAAAVNGLMIRTTITGGGKESDVVELPESIKVRTPVLVDEPEQEVEMDLILGGKRDGTEVYAQLSSADLREAEIAAFDLLVEKLRAELVDDEKKGLGFTVTHGTVSQTRWDRLRA